MARYSDSVVETVKQRLRLSEVVGSYVRLTKQGNTDDYKACCPFHSEKTPSFLVHDREGFYKCFGCGKSGNMFTFVMEMEHVGFPDAIKLLAEKAGVPLKEENEYEKRESDKTKTIQDIYNRIIKSFNSYLMTKNEASHAREYLSKRKISSDTVSKFMLGYATADSSWLYDFLKKNNYSDEVLKETGLFSRNYENLPLFRDRILFPIRNWRGNCVAFGGRDLTGESKAKYINTPETAIYSKRNNLFGLYESLPELKKREEIILCEGNFDVISLHQAGLSYAAAPLGTAFTDEQARLIKRYCKRVNLLFDTDAAGRNATVKALIICQNNGLETRVIRPFEDNIKDASQMLEEKGAEELLRSCSNTEGGFSYLVHSALKMYDIRQPKGKSSVFKEVKPFLDATESSIERQDYFKYLSDILRVSQEQIIQEYEDSSGNEKAVADSQDKPVIVVNEIKAGPELKSMLLLLNNPQWFDRFKAEIKFNFLTDTNARMLYTVLEDAQREEIKTQETLLQMISDENLKNYAYGSITDVAYRPVNIEQAVNDVIKNLKLKRLEDKRANVQLLIETAQMEGTPASDFISLLETVNELDREIMNLKAQFTEGTNN
ncbi:MAG: DNA primase [Sphaerochaetaceae bacterium]|nr:DNA primase [Sphaerochaetaceae bacterium]